MKKIALVAASMLLGCGGGAADQKDDTGANSPGVMAACEAAVADARKAIEASKSVSPAMATDFSTYYAEWRGTVDGWQREDHPCLNEGPEVMTRLTSHQEVGAELDEADDALQDRLAPAFVAKPDATAFFDVLFAGGDRPTDEARRAAFNVAKVSQNAHFEAFKEHGWAILDEKGKTTCTTSGDPFAPTEEVLPQMLKVFENEVDVHVLCRLPVDASAFDGDEAGNLRIELSNTEDWEDEPVTAVDLGAPSKWGKTRYFTARFRVPLKSTRDAETYWVNLVARRPSMGDELVVGTSFWWFR